MPFPTRLKFNFLANYANLYAPMNGSLIKPIFRVNFDCATGIEPFIGTGPATYTCASTAQYSAVCPDDLDGDPIGTIKTAAIDQPRIEKEGVLLEGASENLFLNSQAPATQSIILAAGTYTISVVGTGSISTSYGSATEATDLTFTTVGETLLFTVVGSLDTAQVEKLPFATSIIYTAASPVTRAATNLTYPVPAGFDPALFSIECEFDVAGLGGTQYLIEIGDSNDSNIRLQVQLTGGVVFTINSGLGSEVIIGSDVVFPNTKHTVVATIDSSLLMESYLDGVKQGQFQLTQVPSGLVSMYIGRQFWGGNPLFGHIKSLKISDYDVLAGA